MKKELLMMLGIAGTLFVTSCINELDTTGKNSGLDKNGEAAVNIMVSPLPDMDLRQGTAVADGNLRYVVAAYSVQSESEIPVGTPVKQMETEQVKQEGQTPVNLSMRLTPGKYAVLVWADYGEEYYNAADLLAVSDLNTTTDLAKKDAYSGKGYIEVNTDGVTVSNLTVTMQHAVAKITIRANDMRQLLNFDGSAIDYTISAATIGYENIPATFNVATRQTTMAATSTARTINITPDYAAEALTIQALDLVTDYIFADETTDAAVVTQLPKIDIQLTYTPSTGTDIKQKSYTVADVPVKMRHRTLLSGNLFGESWLGLDVTIDDEWGSDIEIPVE